MSSQHPIRPGRMIQSWIDAASGGFNSLLLHQIAPRQGAHYDPNRCIRLIAVVLAMRNVALERRIRVAATLLHDHFSLVPLDEEFVTGQAVPRHKNRRSVP